METDVLLRHSRKWVQLQKLLRSNRKARVEWAWVTTDAGNRPSPRTRQDLFLRPGLMKGRVSSCQSRTVLDKGRYFQRRSREKVLRKVSEMTGTTWRTEEMNRRRSGRDRRAKRARRGLERRPSERVSRRRQTLWIINKGQKKGLKGGVLSGFSERTWKQVRRPLRESLKAMQTLRTFRSHRRWTKQV